MVNPVNFLCSLCGKRFHRADPLRRHEANSKLHTAQHTSDQELFTCPICSRNFTSKGRLRCHMAAKSVHDDPGKREAFVCSDCGKQLSSKRCLVRHVREVHGDKNCMHQCSICDMKFRRKETLAQHVKTVHDRKKDYFCKICPKIFGAKSSLTQHALIHENRKPYECKYCAKSFKTAPLLKQHYVVHFPNRKHKCNICGFATSLKKTLMVHIRNHKGQSRRLCQICCTTFSKTCGLKRHMRRMHYKAGSYDCWKCLQLFSTKYDLQQHFLSHLKQRNHSKAKRKEKAIRHVKMSSFNYIKQKRAPGKEIFFTKIQHCRRGHRGRVEKLTTKISKVKQGKGSGSVVSNFVRKFCKKFCLDGDDICHIAGAQIGGRGEDERNVFAGSREMNIRYRSLVEVKARKYAEMYQHVHLKVKLRYNGKEVRPYKVHAKVIVRNRVVVRVALLNTLPTRIHRAKQYLF